MELFNLRDLLQHEIEDLYSAEEQIIEALPKMVEKATERGLKKALNEHLKVTREHKKRLDKVLEIMRKDGGSEQKKGLFERLFGSGTKCKGTEGLITEGEKMMGEDMDPNVMDAAIIASAQKIEHYEISGYGTARAYARELGLSQVAKLLDMTLEEEYEADGMLTSLALNRVNVGAEKTQAGQDEKKSTSLTNGKKAQAETTRSKSKTATRTRPKKSGTRNKSVKRVK